MPKGKATTAKCSQLRRDECLENPDECEWNKDIGRCKVKDHASSVQGSVERNRPVVRAKTTQQVVRLSAGVDAPQVQARGDDILEVLTKYFISAFLHAQATPARCAEYKPLVRDFIAVRFMGQYDGNNIDNYKKLISEVKALDPYKQWALPDANMASIISYQLMHRVIAMN